MRFGIFALAFLAACGGDDTTADTGAPDTAVGDAMPDVVTPPPDPTCNPLAPEWDCMLPFPSDYFLEDDATTPNGVRLEIPVAARVTANAGPFNPSGLHVHDGFSPGTPIMFLFPVDVEDEPLVFHTDDVMESLGPDSPTILIDADTGERILHFAEIDPTSPIGQRALFIRPLVPLAWGHRHVVGVRGLTDTVGAPLETPEGFAKIVSGDMVDASAALVALAARYDDDVFAPLSAAGVSRDELQIAWDFTVRSEENTTGDMVGLRDDLIARMEATPPAVTVTEVMDDYSESTFRRIEATVTVPAYVDSAEIASSLNRDAEGDVVADGTFEVPFTILIPRSVAARDPSTDPPARALQFGHGFFGSREEPASNTIHEIADDRGFVVFAADWWGMSEPDGMDLGTSLASDADQTMKFTDRTHQGMANFMALARAITTTLVAVPELSIGGELVYEPSAVHYYGISQGHILGGTFLALSPDIERGVLGVGGANFSLMMFRARPFFPFLAILAAIARDPVERQKVQIIAQQEFDRIDPLSYAARVVTDPYPGAPADRRVLLQIGIADAQVTTLAAQMHARALGAVHLMPSPRPIQGLATATAPYDGAAVIVEHDFGVVEVTEAIIPAENEVHEGVRRLPASQEQLDLFLRPGGIVEHHCDGPCDPE